MLSFRRVAEATQDLHHTHPLKGGAEPHLLEGRAQERAPRRDPDKLAAPQGGLQVVCGGGPDIRQQPVALGVHDDGRAEAETLFEGLLDAGIHTGHREHGNTYDPFVQGALQKAGNPRL